MKEKGAYFGNVGNGDVSFEKRSIVFRIKLGTVPLKFKLYLE